MSKLNCRLRHSFFLYGLLSILWLLFRTGSRPTRMSYPCQRASAAAGSLWIACYILPIAPSLKSSLMSIKSLKGRKLIFAGILLALTLLLFLQQPIPPSVPIAPSGQAVSANQGAGSAEAKGAAIGLSLAGRQAGSLQASDIFAVNGTDGNDGGIKRLIDLMQNSSTPFYSGKVSGRPDGSRESNSSNSSNSSGVVGRDDMVIIKVNCQWDERGGTNSDLVYALIQAIIDHPLGFQGEVVIADNGQGQFGSTGHGGSLSYQRNNAENISRSMQDVADSFPGHNVSAYLWDAITENRVEEYSEGDMQDGYVVADGPDPESGITVTYPKFRTKYGTLVSFKLGVWDPAESRYYSERLKVINVPVLKTHGGYGVTASVKHYMGVASDRLSREAGGRAHSSVGTGGMGTEMVRTRFPALNILDAIWINAHPGGGPATSYSEATKAGIIAASTDPVALDSWAAREILMPAGRALGYEDDDLSTMDPDSLSPGSFGSWLRLSKQQIEKAGFGVTMEEDRIDVKVVSLSP